MTTVTLENCCNLINYHLEIYSYIFLKMPRKYQLFVKKKCVCNRSVMV